MHFLGPSLVKFNLTELPDESGAPSDSLDLTNFNPGYEKDSITNSMEEDLDSLFIKIFDTLNVVDRPLLAELLLSQDNEGRTIFHLLLLHHRYDMIIDKVLPFVVGNSANVKTTNTVQNFN